jgi:uncharacterized protein (DUF433 family)
MFRRSPIATITVSTKSSLASEYCRRISAESEAYAFHLFQLINNLVPSRNPLGRQSNPCLKFHRVATVEAEVFISMLESVPMSSELLNRITSNPRQCGGRPCIRGMRIRVKDVLDMLAGGASEQEILADFPYLEPDDIRASLEYAAAQIDHAVVMVSQ